MKKVLILGCFGNLGTQLVKIFQPEYKVIALDRDSVDLLNFSRLNNVIKQYNPDAIINAVAFNNVDACEKNKIDLKLAFLLNKDLPRCLAEISSDIDAIFVHFSSDYVFGDNTSQKSFSENDKACPVQKYGETKLAGETEILKIKEENNNFKYYIVRTSKLFGPKGSSEFSKPSFFDIMLKLSDGRDKIDVVDEEFSCFTYTVDLANSIKKLLSDKYNYGIYHIVNEGIVSWYGGACELFKIKGIKTKVKAVDGTKFSRPAKRPMFSALKNNKFIKLRHYSKALKDCFGIES